MDEREITFMVDGEFGRGFASRNGQILAELYEVKGTDTDLSFQSHRLLFKFPSI
jgi:hypothetical protein